MAGNGDSVNVPGGFQLTLSFDSTDSVNTPNAVDTPNAVNTPNADNATNATNAVSAANVANAVNTPNPANPANPATGNLGNVPQVLQLNIFIGNTPGAANNSDNSGVPSTAIGNLGRVLGELPSAVLATANGSADTESRASSSATRRTWSGSEIETGNTDIARADDLTDAVNTATDIDAMDIDTEDPNTMDIDSEPGVLALVLLGNPPVPPPYIFIGADTVTDSLGSGRWRTRRGGGRRRN